MSHTSPQSSVPHLATKCIPPQLPLALVGRPRLLRDLDAALTHRLVLISASAGSGKTTLLSTWARSVDASARQVAWLSLDSLDNDPTHFWTSVVTALRTSGTDAGISLPSFGEVPLAMLRSQEPAQLSAALTILLNEILKQPKEIVLALDDYQVIEDQTIHEALTFLIDHAPANLHVIIASRADADMPLARWRVRGQMCEIRDPDLRFLPEEAASFLTHTVADSPLTKEEVLQLVERTEGWIAGLQLAALALSRHKDRAAFLQTFTGSHRYLMDYVQQEILKRQPPSLQHFLLQSAVLSRMNAGLCQAVTGEPWSQELLEMLERNNLFLIPLDAKRQWYRLHDLFREVLLVRLQTIEPEQVSHLRLRAAHWYEEQGEIREAVTYALAATDFSYATSLMEHAAEVMWLHGETQTLYHWIMTLPDVVVREHARLVLVTAFYLLSSSASTAGAQQSRVRIQVERMMARVEVVLQDLGENTLPASELALLQRRLHLLHLLIESYECVPPNDVKRLSRISQAMQQLDQDDEILWQMIPLGVLFILHYAFLQEGEKLVPRLQEAKQRMGQTHNYYTTIKVSQWLVLAYVDAGQLYLAHQECLTALALLQHIEVHAILAGYLSAVLAYILYQWNRLVEVDALVQKNIQEATAWQQIDLCTTGYTLFTMYALAAGDLTSVHRNLQKLDLLLQQERVAAYSAPQITAFRVQYWLATGDLAAASFWAAQAIFHPENWNPRRTREFLALVRVYCAQQRYTQAIEALERFDRHLDQPEKRREDTHEFLAVSVAAFHAGGKRERARSVLARLLQMTEAGGYIRVYLDAGEPMRHALQALLDAPLQDAGFSHAYVATLLAAFEQEEQKLTQSTNPSSADPQEDLSTPVLVEPLSSAEQRVLRLLAAGRSNPEIAQTLVVSVNTVRTHIQSIYRKLAVHNRVEASKVARRLRLLSSTSAL